MSDSEGFTFLKLLLAELEFDLDVAEKIHELIRRKKPKVQLAFWMKGLGATQETIAHLLDVNQATVSRWLKRDCADVKDFLKNH